MIAQSLITFTLNVAVCLTESERGRSFACNTGKYLRDGRTYICVLGGYSLNLWSKVLLSLLLFCFTKRIRAAKV